MIIAELIIAELIIAELIPTLFIALMVSQIWFQQYLGGLLRAKNRWCSKGVLRDCIVKNFDEQQMAMHAESFRDINFVIA